MTTDVIRHVRWPVVTSLSASLITTVVFLFFAPASSVIRCFASMLITLAILSLGSLIESWAVEQNFSSGLAIIFFSYALRLALLAGAIGALISYLQPSEHHLFAWSMVIVVISWIAGWICAALCERVAIYDRCSP